MKAGRVEDDRGGGSMRERLWAARAVRWSGDDESEAVSEVKRGAASLSGMPDVARRPRRFLR